MSQAASSGRRNFVTPAALLSDWSDAPEEASRLPRFASVNGVPDGIPPAGSAAKPVTFTPKSVPPVRPARTAGLPERCFCPR